MDTQNTRTNPILELKRAALAMAEKAGDAASAARLRDEVGALEERERGVRSALHGKSLRVINEQPRATAPALPNIPRVCATCRHWQFQAGQEYSPGYSTYTGGDPERQMEIRCGRGVWEVKPYTETERSYREKQLLALVCDDYSLVDIG